MKTIGFFLVSLFTFSFSLFGQTGAEYCMPLKIGNYLLYNTPSNNTGWGARTTREFIDGTDTIGGKLYYRQIGTETDFSGTDTFHVFWLRKDQAGNILMGAFSEGDNTADSAMILDPPYPYFTAQNLVPGYVLISEWGKDSVMSKTETVQVPAGTFQNCIKIKKSSFDDSGKVRVNEYVYYAKNIGEVQYIRDVPADQAHTCSLTAFQNLVTVERGESSIPRHMVLSQNYPNPFNPSTTISYSLPASSYVKLTIHDILGRVMTTLVNEEQSAGRKEIQWNAAGYSSGVYFYRLSAEGITVVRSMIMVQ
jgi:hypothetical protein